MDLIPHTCDNKPHFDNSLEYAKEQDLADPLKMFRSQFHIPKHNGKDCIYFTGNSLGLQPRTVKDYIAQELEDWATLGVEGHFKAKHPWAGYHEQFAAPIAKLVGAQTNEVVVMNQLTVNLHLLLTTFYRPTKERYKIICEAKAFPSDQYALESQVKLHGFDPGKAIIEIAPAETEQTIRTSTIIEAIQQHGQSVALVIFGGVNYYTGQVMDMQAITEAAHTAGAYAGFDLAHAVGNISLQVHNWNVDFACWCSYKYLNSGPGGVSGVYIHEKYAADTSLPRLAGWWGTNKKNRFQMLPQFDPIPTAEGWQLSNAPVISMAAHKASLDVFEQAGLEALVKKSKKLTSYLFYILDEINEQQRHQVIDVITPREAHGCQVSMFMLEKGRQIFGALMEEGIIADWREPNVIRIAPVPLYNTFEEVWRFGNVIQRILEQQHPNHSAVPVKPS